MLAGEDMGSVRALCIRVADLTLTVRSEAAGPPVRVQGPSRKFLVPADGRSDVTLDASWGDLSRSDAAGPLVFDSGGAWRLHEEPDNQLGFRFFASNTGDSPYLLMRLARDIRSGTLTFHRPFYPAETPIDPLQFPADELLMVHLLGQGMGVEIHACGVVDESGKGYLFAGQSGDGKTTTARLWEGRPGVHILSDDRVIVRREGDEFVMYGTPWHGEAELAESLKAPLDAIFLLARGARNEVIRIPAPVATAELLARSFVPFHDTGSVERTLCFLEQLADRVPCARLPFVPDESICDFVARFGEEGPSTVALD